MKLYHVQGNDTEGESQDFFVVAQDVAQAKDLWNDACVDSGLARDWGDEDDGLPRTQTFDPTRIRVVLEDVDGTPYQGPARWVNWPDLLIEFEK